MTMRRIALSLVMLAALGGVVEAQVIDRILAVVDGSIITMSDALGAFRLGLVKAPPDGDAVAAAVQQLIQRQLMLAEVDRYAPPQPSEAEIDKKLEGIRARFAAPAQFDQVLKESGLTIEQLRRQISDDLRIQAYMQQRFGSVIQQPTEPEILKYYQTHQVEFLRAGVPRSLDEVHDDIRAALIASRRATQIREWIDGLRRRATVSVLVNAVGG
jgi:hypothetical protein